MRTDKGTILVVEDDPHQRSIIKTILTKEGYYVEDVDTGKKALEMVKKTTLPLPFSFSTTRKESEPPLPCHHRYRLRVNSLRHRSDAPRGIPLS